VNLFWQAHYYQNLKADDERRKPIPVQVRLTEATLEFSSPVNGAESWPLPLVRQTMGRRLGEPVRLEIQRQDVASALVFDDPAILEELRQRAPALAEKVMSNASETRAVSLLVAIPIALVVGAVCLLVFGIPFFTRFGAQYVPVSWEEKLGKMASEQDAAIACKDPAVQQAVEQIVAKLKSTVPGSPYTYRVKVLQQDQVNAFAAPGGYVVVLSGLLKKTARPEELAAVLAHELHHVEQRHTTQQLLRTLGFGVIGLLLTGDSTAGSLATELGQLHFSRSDEEEADYKGFDSMVKAKIDPSAMADMFRVLQKESAEMPEMLAYLSTHPDIPSRIQKAERRAKQLGASTERLLPGTNWSELKNACQ
jgi:beta-barrel assembly-enhancing protease